MRAREISDLIGEVVALEGAELVELQLSGSSRRPILRAYVDIPGGTTVDACAELSRRIEARLEAAELVGERYVLEVSSPGLDRPLRRRRDFARLVGRPVRLRLELSAEAGRAAARAAGSTPGRSGRPAASREVVGVLEGVGGPGGVGGEEAGDFWIVVRPEGWEETLRLEAREIAFARPHVPW